MEANESTPYPDVLASYLDKVPHDDISMRLKNRDSHEKNEIVAVIISTRLPITAEHH
jgi:hypothetical protein